MKASKLLSTALENLKQRKLRTSLTTLGVVIGITTIIALASLGEGLRIEIQARLESGFELNVLIVFPGSFLAGFGSPFVPTDVANMRNVSGVTLVTPMMTMPTAQIDKSNGSKLGAFTVGAVNFTEMGQMFPQRFKLAYGAFPEPDENDTVVLGYKAATRNGTAFVELNENLSLIMRSQSPPYTVYVNRTLRVSGILQEGGTSGITNFDYWGFIPLNAGVEINGGEKYQIILVQVNDPETGQQIATDIEGTFANPYAVSVFVPSSLVRQVDNVLNIITIFLLAVASISLLVAGVGIMNIMTVSVMERTREIGILKAIGAKSRTVLAMFLAEAILIGVLGGVIGIFAGYGLSYGLAGVLSRLIQPQQQDTVFQNPDRQTLTVTPVFSLEWTVIAFAFAVVVCIIFGLYPARKASKLNPVEALRYE